MDWQLIGAYAGIVGIAAQLGLIFILIAEEMRRKKKRK